MRLIYFFIVSSLLNCSGNTFSQGIELSAGVNFNKFFSYDGSFYNPEFGSGFGWNLEFGYSISDEKKFKPSFSLFLANYSGDFSTKAYGWTYSESHSAEVRNTALGISFFPLSVNLFDQRLKFRMGFTGMYIWHATISGIKKWNYPYSGGAGSVELEPGVETPVVGSITTDISYHFSLGYHWQIAPVIQYGLGITNDYKFEQRVEKMLFSAQVRFCRVLGN